jgi:hypothetical protein
MERTNTLLDKNNPYHAQVHCAPPWPLEKWCPFINLLYLWVLVMALSFAITFIGRLMTFEVNISHVGSVTTTSTTKTWSSQVM